MKNLISGAQTLRCVTNLHRLFAEDPKGFDLYNPDPEDISIISVVYTPTDGGKSLVLLYSKTNPFIGLLNHVRFFVGPMSPLGDDIRANAELKVSARAFVLSKTSRLCRELFHKIENDDKLKETIDVAKKLDQLFPDDTDYHLVGEKRER
jgi:hypothetical protein